MDDDFTSKIIDAASFSCPSDTPSPLKAPPCNLERIDLYVTPLGDVPKSDGRGERVVMKAVLVQNDRPINLGVLPKQVSSDDRSRMRGRAVYVHLRVPFSAAQEKGPSSTKQLNEFNSTDKRVFSAQALVAAATRCGQHPKLTSSYHGNDKEKDRSKDQQGVSDRSALVTLEVERHSFDLDWWKKALFKGQLLNVFDAIAAESIYDFTSCGLPVAGRPRAALSGLARVTSMSDWAISISSPAGFSFEFGTTRSKTRQGNAMVTRTDHVSTVDGKVKKWSTEAGSVGGDLAYSAATEDGKLNRPASWRAGESDNALVNLSQHEAGLSNKAERKRVEAENQAEIREAMTEGEATGDLPLEPLDNARASTRAKLLKELSVTGSVNGVALSTKTFTDAVDNVTEAIGIVTDAILMVTRTINEGLKGGIPYTISFGLNLTASFFKGSFSYRAWSEARSAISGPGFYVVNAEDKWQIIAKAMIADVKVTVFASFAANIIHAKIAHAEVKFEIGFKAIVDVSFAFSSGDGPGPVTLKATPGLLPKITVEGRAATAYFIGEGSGSGSVTFKKSYVFAGNTITKDPANSKISASRVACKVECWAGIVRHEFLVDSKGEPCWRFPKEGDLVIMKEQDLVNPW